MKTLLAVLAFALVFASRAIAVTSPADFTRAYAKAFREAAPHLKIVIVKDLELKLADGAENEHLIYLDNAYQSYQESPATGRDVIRRYVASTIESLTPDANELQRDRIVPIIKDRAWLEEMRAVQPKGEKTSKPGQVWEDYNEDLVIVYAEDSPRNIRYFGADDLAKIKLAPADLRAIAVKNLRTVVPDIALKPMGDLFLLTADGAYEASLLLAEGIWTGGQVKVSGEIVVAIPARDVLLITGSKNPAGLKLLRQKAAELSRTAPYRLTPKLFVFRGGKFVAFTE
ncbi:MAG TPA: DUF1444 family protein [Opitutaceae bacterium]|nr:DUF1444 family protein [Opitutaceae bacterium]